MNLKALQFDFCAFCAFLRLNQKSVDFFWNSSKSAIRLWQASIRITDISCSRLWTKKNVDKK
jgi:hypothetical protein